MSIPNTCEQQTRNADRIYITKFNDEHRVSARVVCLAVLLVSAFFSTWDITTLGPDHPELYSTLLQRLALTIPSTIGLLWYSYQKTLPIRLDYAMFIGATGLGIIMVNMHFQHIRIGIDARFESIIMSMCSVYFLPNIFYYQKLLFGITMLICHYIGLDYYDRPNSEFINNGAYIIGISIAGIMMSYYYDKYGRENFGQTRFLKAMANTDQLTGVGNRHKFDEHFSQLLSTARKENKGIAIAIADIDFFKQYNDNYGHLAGDECLIQVAQTLLLMKRHPLDNCIRFGGEEFIMIKYDINKDDCQAWGEKIKNAIYQLDVSHDYSKIDNRITISAGVIHWEPSATLTRTELMKFADDALYRAKDGGRNKVMVHGEHPTR